MTGTSIMGSFVILVLLGSLLLRELRHRIDRLAEDFDRIQSNKYGWIATELKNWKRQHLLVCQFVDRINECFGFIIFLVVVHGFVVFILQSFKFANSFKPTKREDDGSSFSKYWPLIEFSMEFALLFSAVYSPYILQKEVISKRQWLTLFCWYITAFYVRRVWKSQKVFTNWMLRSTKKFKVK